MSPSLCWLFCEPCADDSSELETSSLTVLPSWLGDDVILTLPTGMPPLSIRSPYCEASGCTPSSVVVLDCRSSFCFPLPTHTMLPLHNVSWHGLGTCTRSILGSSVWMLQAWGLRLIAWIHQVLGAVAVVAYNPKNRKKGSCLPPTWTREELGKRSSIERFFGRVFLFFHLQRPPLTGWSEIASQVALTYTASVIVGLAAQQVGRLDLIRSPKRVLAHLWEGDSEL
jgi:hypothetical protein